MSMNQNDWILTHPYLRPLAALHAIVDAAVSANSTATLAFPDWNDYASDFYAGVPLLQSSTVTVDVADVASMFARLLHKLALELPEKLAEQSQALASEIGFDEGAARRAIDSLLGRGDFRSECPGLMRFVGWSMLAYQFRPTVAGFGGWREEDRWYRPYCPTCGSLPAMAQLVGVEPGRRRLLVCGCCGTRWSYRRTGCPFCEIVNEPKVSVLTIAGEAGLRIDFCERCRGYLKTYVGEGSEDVLLADWTSIHLDMAAADRGLKRLAISLYEV